MKRPGGLSDAEWATVQNMRAQDDGRVHLVEDVLVRRVGDRMRRSPGVRHQIAVEIVYLLDQFALQRRAEDAQL